MKTIGLLFPGQGSQYVGMAKDLYDHYPRARAMVDQANDVIGFDLRKILFEGPEETLRQTQYTQPAIFVASIAAFTAFTDAFPADRARFLAAGHSLGEYSAMCAAGVFPLDAGLRLVRARGEFIQKASETSPGSMAAIIGLERNVIEGICRAAAAEGTCEPVNFNSPGQIVIAGSSAAVAKAVALAQEKGATKAVALNVSGPFHSSLMSPAAGMMREELEKYSFAAPVFPVITNCDAVPNDTSGGLKQKLVSQINHPVLWEDSIRRMTEMGAALFIEIGPQRVLSGLLRRIDKAKKALNIEDRASLEKTVESLKLQEQHRDVHV